MYHFVLKDVSFLIVIMQLKDESRNTKSTYNIIERNTVFEPRLKSLKKGYIYYSMNKNPGKYYYYYTTTGEISAI